MIHSNLCRTHVDDCLGDERPTTVQLSAAAKEERKYERCRPLMSVLQNRSSRGERFDANPKQEL